MSKLNLYEGMIVNDTKLLHLLGSGESGEVWSALTNDNKIIALKIYSGKNEAKSKATYEYNMARCFSHENILAYQGISFFESHPVLHLPCCEGRSVDGIASYFSERMIWKLIVEISDALTEIHSKGFAHFDIKPSNILWDGQKFILSDFGACMNISNASFAGIESDSSSYKFNAPELNTKHCTASDIWSLGATIFYLYMGCHIFNGLGGKAQHQDSPIPFMRKSLPTLSRLVHDCLDFDPEKRPTSRAINEIAKNELIKLNGCTTNRNPRHTPEEGSASGKSDFWPEPMIETTIKNI